MPRAHTRHRRHDLEERRALRRLLQGGTAHAALAEGLRSFPRSLSGAALRGAPHTSWELLEHLRIAQRDILDFSRDPQHPSPPWPAGYWPASSTPPDGGAWEKSARAFLRDLGELVRIACDPACDLAAPIPGTTTTWLGQLYMVASHNSYHLGQLFLLRRTLAGKRRRG